MQIPTDLEPMQFFPNNNNVGVRPVSYSFTTYITLPIGFQATSLLNISTEFVDT